MDKMCFGSNFSDGRVQQHGVGADSAGDPICEIRRASPTEQLSETHVNLIFFLLYYVLLLRSATVFISLGTEVYDGEGGPYFCDVKPCDQ